MFKFCCKFTSVSVCQKLPKYNAVCKVIAKIKGYHFFAPQCIVETTFMPRLVPFLRNRLSFKVVGK